MTYLPGLLQLSLCPEMPSEKWTLHRMLSATRTHCRYQKLPCAALDFGVSLLSAVQKMQARKVAFCVGQWHADSILYAWSYTAQYILRVRSRHKPQEFPPHVPMSFKSVSSCPAGSCWSPKGTQKRTICDRSWLLTQEEWYTQSLTLQGTAAACWTPCMCTCSTAGTARGSRTAGTL